MRKALRCCRFPLIIVKRWEQSAECVSSCRKPLTMVLRDKSIACCKLYDIFIPATAFICEKKKVLQTYHFRQELTELLPCEDAKTKIMTLKLMLLLMPCSGTKSWTSHHDITLNTDSHGWILCTSCQSPPAACQLCSSCWALGLFPLQWGRVHTAQNGP